jgi:mono/diheme cytochrome c family protein
MLPIALAASAILAACSGQSARVSPIQALTPDLNNGKTVYTANCASCHGSDGKGTGGSEKKNVASVAASNKASAIDQVVSGGDGMPAYDGLTNQQIADVIGYLASLN